MGPPGSLELPLAAYRAATLRSVGGVVTSRGIEPRSLGLQPSAMTTPARWSLWWSRRRESNPRLRVTRAPCLRQHFVDGVPPAGVEPAWFRLKGGRISALPRRGTTGRRLAVGPGFEPGSFRLTAGRVAVATTLQARTNGRVGRTRTSTRLRPRQVGCRLPYDPKGELG